MASYFTIRGRVETVDDASYEREAKQPDKTVKTEKVEQFEVSLRIPGMRDNVRVVFAADVAPKPDTLAKWELEEPWVVVECDAMRSNAFEGSKQAFAVVSFSGIAAREMDAKEREAMNNARQQKKLDDKQKRAARKAERAADKQEDAKAQKKSA